MTFPRYAEPGEVVLGVDDAGEAVHLRIVRDQYGPGKDISTGVVGIFPPHQIIGDPTRARHLLLSEFVQSNWAGGGQISRLQESTDPDRYDFATLDTRWPHTLTLLPLTVTLEGPNFDGARPLGMFAGKMVVAYGTELREVTATPGLTGGGALGATPNDNGAVEFRGSGAKRLFIPCGSTYKTWNGAAVAAGAGGVDALSFLVYDDKLYVLETDGEIKFSLDGTTWSPVQATLETGWVPRSLQLYRDRGDNQVPYVVTDSHLWAFDPGGPLLVRTDMDPPRHPYHGLASAPFDGELWVGAGVGAYGYGLSTKRQVGPDRDDGLPPEYRGTIVSFAPYLNGMLTLLRGVQSADASAEEFEADDGVGEGDAYAPTASGQSILMVWDRRAWHTLWTGGSTGSTPTRVEVETKADGTYRAWWGFAGALWWQDLSVDFLNPKFATTTSFAPSGFLTFGELDGGNEAQEKTAASVEARTRNCTASETIAIGYSVDGGQHYHAIATITSNGTDGQTLVIQLGDRGLLPDGTPWYEGIDFHQFKTRVDMARGSDPTKHPILESLSVVYFPKMGQLDSWEFTVDASDEYKGRGPRDVETYLRSLIGQKFVPFCPDDRWHVVKVTGVSGAGATGQDQTGQWRVSIVQARES